MGSPADLARVLELARASEKGYDALKGKFKQEEPEPVVKPKKATKKQDKYDIDDLTRDFARLKASDEAKMLKLIEENRRLRSQGQGYEDYNDEYGDYDELPEVYYNEYDIYPVQTRKNERTKDSVIQEDKEQRSNEKWNQKRRSVEEKNVIEEVEMEKPSMKPGEECIQKYL
ncbi:unnamed protein product [Rhizophagus irregularis]|nr:unnamed protein product [Rhizophagus irregularis]